MRNPRYSTIEICLLALLALVCLAIFLLAFLKGL
jgi:hypothetical protein